MDGGHTGNATMATRSLLPHLPWEASLRNSLFAEVLGNPCVFKNHAVSRHSLLARVRFQCCAQTEKNNGTKRGRDEKNQDTCLNPDVVVLFVTIHTRGFKAIIRERKFLTSFHSARCLDQDYQSTTTSAVPKL